MRLVGVSPDHPRPDEAAIRRALAECMTVGDIDDAMGWAPGTARRRRWRAPERGGLPNADAELGGIALWFRTTIQDWQATQVTHRPRSTDTATDAATAPAETASLLASDEDAVPNPTDDREPRPGPDDDNSSSVAQVIESDHPSAPEPAPETLPAGEDIKPTADGATADAVGTADEDGAGVVDETAPADGDVPGAAGVPDGTAAASSTRPAEPAVVESGFDVAVGQHVVAEVRGGWRAAVVAQRDRTTVVVEYQLDDTPLGARRQRVGTERVRIPIDDA